jgi:histidinol dehydrogenase
MSYIKRLSTFDNDFWSQLEALVVRDGSNQEAVMDTVIDILRQVRTHGDAAVLEYTRRFDRVDANKLADLEVSQERLGQALTAVSQEQLSALETAAQRIRGYAERQKLTDWRYTEADGTVLGQQIIPLDKVGLYVPGGKAAYPSSVLMNAIPAKVAGVATLVMVVPTPDGHINELVLAAAAVAGVDRVFAVGGAQAVAALAYGTESIPRVDKIVGPGNSYVAMAKRLVFGTVGIDMIAGPSEILVVCDGETNPDWIAMDLFSQAEHDEEAQPILITPDKIFIDRVQASINALLPTMERREIIAASLKNQAAFIHVRDLLEAAQVSNFIAPEHLELSIADPDALLPHIRHAGAIFLGRYTAEALGDYCAGPNHVLPTARTARFSSPLGVYDFQKRSSLINCSPEGAAALGRIASVLAEGEGLTAHARSARFRIDQSKP